MMVRRVKNHVALAIRPRHSIELVALDGRLRRGNGEGGKIVGINIAVIVVRNSPRARAEWAPILRHLRSVLAMGGRRDPFTNRRIPAEFSHEAPRCEALNARVPMNRPKSSIAAPHHISMFTPREFTKMAGSAIAP